MVTARNRYTLAREHMEALVPVLKGMGEDGQELARRLGHILYTRRDFPRVREWTRTAGRAWVWREVDTPGMVSVEVSRPESEIMELVLRKLYGEQ